MYMYELLKDSWQNISPNQPYQLVETNSKCIWIALTTVVENKFKTQTMKKKHASTETIVHRYHYFSYYMKLEGFELIARVF